MTQPKYASTQLSILSIDTAVYRGCWFHTTALSVEHGTGRSKGDQLGVTAHMLFLLFMFYFNYSAVCLELLFRNFVWGTGQNCEKPVRIAGFRIEVLGGGGGASRIQSSSVNHATATFGSSFR
jgi:hypothetical protein